MPLHTTYKELYDDDDTDPYPQGYQHVFREYMEADYYDLENKVYSFGMEIPFGLVMLVRDSSDTTAMPGKVTAYHRINQYIPKMGDPKTVLDRVGYAFKGDLHDGRAPYMVKIPTYAFHSTGEFGEVVVPTAARIDQLLAITSVPSHC